MDESKMMKWLTSGRIDGTRSFEFTSWENPNGIDGVRCILKVSRGSTAMSSTVPFETRIASGSGSSMESAFAKAYEELVGWLI